MEDTGAAGLQDVAGATRQAAAQGGRVAPARDSAAADPRRALRRARRRAPGRVRAHRRAPLGRRRHRARVDRCPGPAGPPAGCRRWRAAPQARSSDLMANARVGTVPAGAGRPAQRRGRSRRRARHGRLRPAPVQLPGAARPRPPARVTTRSTAPRRGSRSSPAGPRPPRGWLAEVRDLSLETSVLRGQVISFSGNRLRALDERHHLASGDPTSRPTGSSCRPARSSQRALPRGRTGRAPRPAAGQGPAPQARHPALRPARDRQDAHRAAPRRRRSPARPVVLLSGTRRSRTSATPTQIARAHQPAIVVLEDCDLIAEDRAPRPVRWRCLAAPLHAARRDGRARPGRRRRLPR